MGTPGLLTALAVFGALAAPPEEVGIAAGRVEVARALRFTHPVAVRVEQPDAMRAAMRVDLEEGWPPEEAERASRVLAAAGLLPDGYDLLHALEALLADGVEGYYDARTADLVLVDRGGPHDATSPVLLHELTHALQDQVLGLWEMSQRETIDDDAGLALRALIEGDASWVERVAAVEALRADDEGVRRNAARAELATLPPLSATDVPGAPPIVTRSLIFPYVEGLRFVAGQYATGGWDTVNAAWREPPLSTEQILHPEKLHGAARDLPQAVAAPDLARLMPPDARAQWSTTLGELGVQVLFEDSRAPDPHAIAAGWGGDTLVGWLADDRVVLAWATTWDTPVDAEAFAAALPDVLVRWPKNAALARRGADVLVVAGLPPARTRRALRRGWATWQVRPVHTLDDLATPPDPRPEGP